MENEDLKEIGELTLLIKEERRDNYYAGQNTTQYLLPMMDEEALDLLCDNFEDYEDWSINDDILTIVLPKPEPE